MPIFGRPGPFDEAVAKICDVGTENDDWQLIMNLCDTVNTTKDGPRNMVRALLRRIKSANHTQLEHAVTLLDACVNNCNKPFHLELCTRTTVNELKEYLVKNKAPTKGITALKENMVKWSKGFGEDPQLYLLQVTILQLKSEGVTFPSDVGNTPPINLPAPPPASVRQQESEDEMLRKAIEASLKESGSGGAAGGGAGGSGGGGGGIYPTFTADKPLSTDRELFKVRALYDFEAAEENEITFKTGDVISVTDNADQNWWKGRTPASSGLFPANFVTRDLAVTPPPDPSTAEPAPVVAKVTEVNPEQIDLLLEMLKKADATVTNAEEDRFVEELEGAMTVQEGLVQAEYDRLKARHEELEGINDDMSRVVGLFHKLLKEAPVVAPVPAPQPIRYSYQPPAGAPVMKPPDHAAHRQFVPPQQQQPPPPTMPPPQPPQFVPYDPYNPPPHQGQHQGPPVPQPVSYQPPQSPPPSYTGRAPDISTGYGPPPPHQQQQQPFYPVYPGSGHHPSVYPTPQPPQHQFSQPNIAHVTPMSQEPSNPQ